MNIEIKKGTLADKDFIIKSIIEAEKSGSDMISYCAIFKITKEKLYELLSNFLDEEMEGQEICASHFLIAFCDGEPAAAISAWIENAEGMKSAMLKSNLLMYYLDREIIEAAVPAINLMNQINILRTDGALQIECVYTAEKFRGMGLASRLIEEHISINKSLHPELKMVDIILLGNNEAAQKAYAKSGFKIVAERKCSDPEILKLLPCDTKVLMQKTLAD